MLENLYVVDVYIRSEFTLLVDFAVNHKYLLSLNFSAVFTHFLHLSSWSDQPFKKVALAISHSLKSVNPVKSEFERPLSLLEAMRVFVLPFS